MLYYGVALAARWYRNRKNGAERPKRPRVEFLLTVAFQGGTFGYSVQIILSVIFDNLEKLIGNTAVFLVIAAVAAFAYSVHCLLHGYNADDNEPEK